MHSRMFRYGLIFLLAMTEIMPVMLLGQTLPVLLRRGGATMDEVGLLYLVMSPWALKFLWAPLLDRFGTSRRGRYRAWLLWIHPALIASVLGLALVDFPSLFFTDRTLAMSLLALLTVICATADTAADGLAIGLLRPEERGSGNGFQMAGTMMGNFVGGGLLLLLLPWLGWLQSCLVLVVLLLVPYAGVIYYREPVVASEAPLTFREVLLPFSSARLRRWLLLVACIEASYAMSYTPMQAILSDRGYSLEEVGIVMGVVGSIAGVLGGAVGAASMHRFGRRASFYGFAALIGLSALSLLFAADPAAPRWVVYSAIELMIFSLMALGTVLYTMMMDRSRSRSASSDYTTQYCALQLASFMAMALGGYFTEAYGKGVVFGLTPLLMLLVFGASTRFLTEQDFSSEPLRGV
jgi:PAT family beta-lactamase induction signal transducer AmpG